MTDRSAESTLVARSFPGNRPRILDSNNGRRVTADCMCRHARVSVQTPRTDPPSDDEDSIPGEASPCRHVSREGLHTARATNPLPHRTLLNLSYKPLDSSTVTFLSLSFLLSRHVSCESLAFPFTAPSPDVCLSPVALRDGASTRTGLQSALSLLEKFPQYKQEPRL